jgi:hypothetical protein
VLKLPALFTWLALWVSRSATRFWTAAENSLLFGDDTL